MSDGPGDMNRELEKKAAEMVEVCCAQCEHLDSEKGCPARCAASAPDRPSQCLLKRIRSAQSGNWSSSQ